MADRAWHYFIDEIDRHEFHGYALVNTLYFGQTKFPSIEIAKSPKYSKMLILDGKIQSTALDEHIYHETLVHPAMLLHPDPRRILILGGGEGAALREVLRYRMVEEVVMVDLDEEVVNLCRKHFPEWSLSAFEDPRTTLVCEDACLFLQRPVGVFDVIIQDITDPVTVDFTEAYYQEIREQLAPGGILAMQALEFSLADFAGHLRVRQEVGKVFPSLLSYRAYIPSFRADWGFLVARAEEETSPLSFGSLAARFSERMGVGAGPRFYGPAMHTALFTLPGELAQLIGQTAEAP